MTFRVIVIPADVNEPLREASAEVGEDRVGDQLHFLQSLVDGYVERVSSPTLSRWASTVHSVGAFRNRPALLVDEEGLLKRRPMNGRASVFYGDGREPYYLHGDAVLIWEQGEDWVTLPPEITIDGLAAEIATQLKQLES